jgi:hypothetical protein
MSSVCMFSLFGNNIHLYYLLKNMNVFF